MYSNEIKNLRRFLINGKLNNSLRINLDRKYYGCTTTNLIIGLLALLNIVSCNGQVKQNENTQTKPTVPTAITEIFERGDSIRLNQYKDGKKDGIWRAYYKNGQLKSEGKFSDDLKEGLHKEWGDNGILLVEGFYHKGKANGLMKWFHEKGHIAGEGNMINDIRVGAWTICDIEENGFCIDAFFKNGERDGVWKIYHDHAQNKLWKAQTFKDDKMISEKCWDEKGNDIECD